MNGRKYGHNYAPRAHGFNRRARSFPDAYYAPKRFPRLNEMLWDSLVGRLKRMRCCGSPFRLYADNGLVRDIHWGQTLGWWYHPREQE